jgi:hypothetical protein
MNHIGATLLPICERSGHRFVRADEINTHSPMGVALFCTRCAERRLLTYRDLRGPVRVGMVDEAVLAAEPPTEPRSMTLDEAACAVGISKEESSKRGGLHWSAMCRAHRVLREVVHGLAPSLRELAIDGGEKWLTSDPAEARRRLMLWAKQRLRELGEEVA